MNIPYISRYKINLSSAVVSCAAFVCMSAYPVFSQPAKGANKFLGNITVMSSIRSDYLKYWNQITGENESKWESVERTRDKMSWAGTDRIAKYSRENGIAWKFHCLVWGSQYPGWMNNLSQSEQLEEITEWLDSAAARYPDVQMIDVINEAYPSHKPPPFKNALGGDGSTGYDWMIKIFKMTRDRWPNAVLIYNDYNTIEWGSEVDWQVKMATAMKKNNSEMDAIGVQAHDAWKVATNTVKGNIDKLAATGYPIIVSEYDIGESNDSRQKQIMEEQFTMFWNHPKIVGVTYWGYIVGRTWRNGTGLLNDGGAERPALTWLVDFVKKNPNPPNDYPKLVKMPDDVSVAPHTTYTIISKKADVSGPMQIFNLQGRLSSSRLENSQPMSVVPVNSAHGCYIINYKDMQGGTIKSLR
ncbi:MAG TPA: endo-1,4-beta-xylanase [Chitinispirillaceae bacterium]|nr:endo-1,4-beta-xylanase [Chitinispirillaceae bacterium]